MTHNKRIKPHTSCAPTRTPLRALLAAYSRRWPRMFLLGTRSFTGGARVGEMNATWPLARLVVRTGKLTLHCFRKFELRPSDVICEPVGSALLLSSGVQFHHIREHPWPLVFLCARRKLVLETLRKAGFEVRE